MQVFETYHKIWFDLRRRRSPVSFVQQTWWSWQGAKFGVGTHVSKLQMTWPHQVCVGTNCHIESDVFFNFDGIWQPGPSIVVGDRVFLGRGCEINIRQGLRIGDDCLIASGCKFIDHDHGIEIGQPMNIQPGVDLPIVVEDDVWLGVNVVALKGVTIGQGAIVGAGAVVTKSIPPFEIWAGVPARKIGVRGHKKYSVAESIARQ